MGNSGCCVPQINLGLEKDTSTDHLLAGIVTEDSEVVEKSRKKGSDAPSVRFQEEETAVDPPGVVKRSSQRKGTGFVHKHQLPELEEDVVKKVSMEEDVGSPVPGRKKVRKGTGFVRKEDVPVLPDDDEDDE
mmetsp:Transcript_71309/g.154915  ORF Transcript_71309/g.154915 Transcript_71309/m.154915 type:complete len:132 (+) Transcript_71309:134-529(+)